MSQATTNLLPVAFAALGGAALTVVLLGERGAVLNPGPRPQATFAKRSAPAPTQTPTSTRAAAEPSPASEAASAEARSLSRSFRAAARRVRLSVLHITTERAIGADHNPFVEMLDRFLPPGASRGEDQPQRVERATGTGFVVAAEGLVLTNNHVVADAKRVLARLADGREIPAEVVGTDPLSDLAVLRLEPREEGYVPVAFGDSDALEVGDWVLAVGSPFGLDQTVTSGIVSAKGRSRVGIAATEDFIQTDAAINPGNSGGPLLDLDGRVIGVTTAIASRDGGYAGIGFAIPVAMAQRVMEDILDHGRVVRAWLGVSIQTATPDLSRRLGLGARAGALVGGVLAGLPAEGALEPGDLIVAVDGTRVEDASRLSHLVAMASPGEAVRLQVIRGGALREVEVTPIERPYEERTPVAEAPAPEEAPAPDVGITARELSPELATFFGFAPDATGVVVARVAPGSRAAQQGIRPGMVIQQVDQAPIRSLLDLEAATDRIDPRQGVALRVWDGNVSHFVLLR